MFAESLKCSSLSAYKRTLPLVTSCLFQAEPDRRRSVVKTLARLLFESGDVSLVRKTCLDVAKHADPSLAEDLFELASSDEDSCTVTYVALGVALKPSDNKMNWLSCLLQASLKHFYSPDVLKLALPSLVLTSTLWNETVSPALLLKAKSHPDKALTTMFGWVQVAVKAGVSPEVTEDYKAVLLKHAVGAKEENRAVTASILVDWASSGAVVRSEWAAALAGTKIALAPARAVVYETLQNMAGYRFEDDEAVAGTIPLVLKSIQTNLTKETKGDQKWVGQQALIEWVVLANASGAASEEYQTALETLRKPLLAKNVSETSQLLGHLVQSLGIDVLKALAVDLLTIQKVEEKKKFEKAVDGWMEHASSKKSTQVEGLLVAYLCLVYATEQKGAKLPSSIDKVFSVSSSFVFSQTILDLVATNAVVAIALPRSLALYMKVTGNIAGKKTAARALAMCSLHPGQTLTAEPKVTSIVEDILSSQGQVAESLVTVLLEQVNAQALQYDASLKDLNFSREAREADREVLLPGKGSEHSAHNGMDSRSVRAMGQLLARHCLSTSAHTIARALVLMHVGSSTKRSQGAQRRGLVTKTLEVIKAASNLSTPEEVTSFRTNLAGEIVQLASQTSGGLSSSADASETKSTASSTDDAGNSDVTVSEVVHLAAVSVVVSLGRLAANFSIGTDDPEDEELRPYAFASRLCVDDIASQLASRLGETLDRVENVSESDMGVFLTARGSLFEETAGKGQQNKVGGKHLSEDEIWELQMKKELAEKKQGASSSGIGPAELSPEQLKIVAQQDLQRANLSSLMEGDLCRLLEAIRRLCGSDIEVGNECLPIFSTNVLATAVSVAPALKQLPHLRQKSVDTLKALAACVYEVHEDHASNMCSALLISCRKDENAADLNVQASGSNVNGRLSVSPLPSPCNAAACTIEEMDVFDDALSGSSFFFLFPVLQAALMGPRTSSGCEACLEVLHRHTTLLAGEGQHLAVASMRKDMVIAVLELLKHDRAQTFHGPTPYETLVKCFYTEDSALTAAEIAPLLDERGALGSRNCRVASMQAVAHIASEQRKSIKANPLVENRLWFNCFEKDEEIRTQARSAWFILHDAPEDGSLPAPSPLFGPPLLPLMSHQDKAIADAASEAYAHAMGMHPKVIGRNVEVLCKSYIDSFPTTGSSETKGSSTKAPSKAATPLAPVKKKTISTGLPKKKPALKKSPLAVAGIGKPKTTKKKLTNSALLKPKEERTLDREALESQFKTGGIKEDEEKDSPQKVGVRLGVLRTVTALTATSANVAMDEATLKLLTSFLMAYGIADSDEAVKGLARNALRDVVASKGGTEEGIEFLLPHLEAVLKTGVADESTLGSLSTDKVPRDISSSDRRKEGAVVALGSVALHLKGPENDDKVDSTVDMLVATLKTPSEEVQLSVADALTKLMKKGKTQLRIESLLSDLMKGCLYGDSLAVRRGSAYGLSAAIKGSGIGALKKYDIVVRLEEACTSGESSSKEGSLFAIELLSSRLGLLFEPYVIVLLPSLLKSFSDSSDYVRTAASHTVGLIMSKLSAHGVKLVMPAVLTAFNDPAWRTKQASIHMLGAMSHLAPKQLASALPKVVPKLTEAFSDTHPKVKSSAQEALNEISTVVKNPEISSISPVLLKALTDPADHTIRALEALIGTEFLHAIDSPSLALIVPILHRGLRDRGATTKRFGGLIAGNICTMINDPKDILPYLPTLLPDLQSALLDPIPDVRSTSAKALGSLTRSLGEQILPELRPWLIQKLRDSSCSSAERSGAAQGLTEVLAASGTSVADETVRNEILPLRSYPEASTREGVLWMLTFLPSTLGQGFTPLIDVSLPALISGLSDDSEPVREVAMRAGRVMIRTHGKVHVDKILPSLEGGLEDDDHRIRVASLSLMGDLLSMIGGTQVIRGDGDTQDDARKAERAQAQIALALGSDTRKRVLSGLYLARSDTVHVVRQSAIQVWKTVRTSTLHLSLPVLCSLI